MIVFAAVLIAGVFMIYENLTPQNNSVESLTAAAPQGAGGLNTATEPQTVASPQTAIESQIKNPPQAAAPKTAASDVKIIYTNSGFSPDMLTIKSGATVIFENQSDSPFWPATGPHPTHTGYPAAGGCVNSAFDACREIDPGGAWSFKFDIAGFWKYHDHLRPSNRGAIMAETRAE